MKNQIKLTLFFTFLLGASQSIQGAFAAVYPKPRHKPTIINLSHKVIKQIGSTCGFHATKNAKFILEWLAAKHRIEALPVSIGKRLLAKNLERETRDENFKKTIDTLLECDPKLLRDLDVQQINDRAHLLGMDMRQFSAIDDAPAPNIKRRLAEELNVLADFLTKIQKKEASTHAFAVGSMQERLFVEDGRPRGTYGHWVTVVVDFDPKDGFTYYYTDSISKPNAKRRSISTEAITNILAMGPEKLRQEALSKESAIQDHMDSAQTVLDKEYPNYLRVVELLSEALKAAITEKVIGTPRFNVLKEEIQKILADIPAGANDFYPGTTQEIKNLKKEIAKQEELAEGAEKKQQAEQQEVSAEQMRKQQEAGDASIAAAMQQEEQELKLTEEDMRQDEKAFAQIKRRRQAKAEAEHRRQQQEELERTPQLTDEELARQFEIEQQIEQRRKG